MQISEQQVEAAESRAAEQERLRDAAAEELAANPYSDLVAGRHTEASQMAAQLRANVKELRAAYEAQVAAERAAADWGALEKAAAGEIKAAGVDLAERERAVVEAVERAQEAVVGVVVAGAAFNAAVQSHADVLAAAGLDLRGGESGGVRTVLNSYRVKVRGREYEQLDVGALAGWVVYRVVEARLSKFNPMVSLLQWVARAVEQTVPGVVAAVPRPDRVEQAKRPLLVDAYRSVRGSK